VERTRCAFNEERKQSAVTRATRLNWPRGAVREMKGTSRSSTFRALYQHWESLAALLAVGVAYALLTGNRRVGPVWLVPILVLALLISSMLAHQTGHYRLKRTLGLGTVGLLTLAIGASVAVIVLRLLRIIGGTVTPASLFRDAILLWVSNIVVFAVWYWELDGGGPLHRGNPYRPTDFAFPQTQMEGKEFEGWCPTFVDYLFLAFNTSTAFSPTDTLILSRNAKLLTILQSLISIATLLVLAARAINTLQ
jgi:hypothetical protein